MRLLTYSAILSLSACALALPAHAEDDIIVNGLHCNNACQSWLGVGGAAAQPGPLRVATPLRTPLLPAPKVHIASREVEPELRRSSAPVAVQMPAHGGGERSASRAPSMPSSVSLIPGDRLTVAPPVIPDAFTQAPARRHSAPGPHPSEQVTFTPASQDDSAPDRLDTPPSGNNNIGPAHYPKHRPTSENADLRLERGLTTLPRLSDVVAVHGTIMVETAEDRAFERREMARLVKETTRPKEFRTGFADPLSEKPAADGQVVGQFR